MNDIGRLSKTEKVGRNIIETIIKGNAHGKVDMFIRANGEIIASGLGMDYDSVIDTLLDFDTAIKDHLTKEDGANKMTDELLKLGFKKEEEDERN